jgi:outer membrane receptor protein involved in Fe transport
LASLALTLSASAQTAPDSSQPAPTNTTSNTNATQNDEPVQLNRLDVTATRDVGYGAATSASTSRVVQNYVDIPQTVNVVTAQFIADYAVQDVRQLLEYTPNITFGLTDNPNNTRIRGSIVSDIYVDGVATPITNSAPPLDFFDRIEVVKGPSSAAFGLGQPGGLINYVSKTPQRIDSTDFYASWGLDKNYRTGIDLQRVDSHTDKLSYRIVAFGDEGQYYIPNEKHSGYGAQFSIRYDVDPTFRIDLISAYSDTNYPSQQIPNTIWNNHTIYSAWQSTNLGSGNYDYLPGTVFSNGSIFGVSGQLPPPGTQIGVPGTGYLAAKNVNSNPSGFFDQGATNDEERETLILNKTFMDGHISVRNALTVDFQTNRTYNESPDEVVSVPGTANTLPAGATGTSYGEPNGFTTNGYGTALGYMGVPGQPFFGVGYSLTYGQGNTSSRADEFDVLGDWKLPGGMELQGLAGGDIYDNESNSLGWQWPDETGGVAGGLPFENNVYTNNNPSPPFPTSGITNTGWSNTHQWGDGVYVQGDLKLFNGMLDLNAGWRIDYFDTVTRNYNTDQYMNSGWLTTKGAPRYAVTIKPVSWLSFYGLYTVHKDPAQVTNTYFLASGTEWGPALQAEYPQGALETYQPGGTTIEGGAKVQFWGGRAYASVAVFHDITQGQLNSISEGSVTNPDGTDTQIGKQEIQGTNVHGIEAELFGQFTPRFSGILNYGYTRGWFPAFSNGLADIIDPAPIVSGHFKYDFGDLQGNGFYVNFGGVGFAPYLLWQNAYGNQVYRTYYTTWQYSVDGSIGFRWHTGKYKHSIDLTSTNFTNQEVSDGTVTPWTTEPMRQGFITYRVQF